jgi:hypothetical protein
MTISGHLLTPRRHAVCSSWLLLAALLLLGAAPAARADEGTGDPFRPPPGQEGKPAPEPPRRLVRGFLRPSLGAAFQLSSGRSFLPQEGFGFGMQVGAELGRDRQRLALSVTYGFARLARTVDIVVGSPELTSCTEVRSATYHLVTATAAGSFEAGPVLLWAGLGGGLAYAQVRDPNETCGLTETTAQAGVLGPEVGVGYRLKPDLFLGLSFTYLHVFSSRTFVDQAGVERRFFHDLISLGASLTLRF